MRSRRTAPAVTSAAPAEPAAAADAPSSTVAELVVVLGDLHAFSAMLCNQLIHTMTPDDFAAAGERFDSLCREMGVDQPFHPAMLYAGDQELSRGRAILDTPTPTGLFVPQDGKTLDTADGRGTLKLLDTRLEVAVEFYRCPAGELHYHLRVQDTSS